MVRFSLFKVLGYLLGLCAVLSLLIFVMESLDEDATLTLSQKDFLLKDMQKEETQRSPYENRRYEKEEEEDSWDDEESRGKDSINGNYIIYDWGSLCFSLLTIASLAR